MTRAINSNNTEFDFDMGDSSYSGKIEPVKTSIKKPVKQVLTPVEEGTKNSEGKKPGELDAFTRQRQVWNKQARQMVYFLEREGIEPSGAGRKVLRRYSGQGGILSSQESKGQYLTPYGITRLITDLLKMSQGTRVYDPTCGTSRFAEYLPAGCQFTGIEIDKTAVKIGKLLYPDATIEHGDILNNLHFREQFDVVLGNPPFGLWWKVDPKKSNLASAAGKILSQWKILEAAITAVKKGGIVGLVIPQNTFKNDRAADQRAGRFWNSNCVVRAEIDLPASAFKSSGTSWPCSIVILQRPPAKTTAPFTYKIKNIKQEYSELIKQFHYSDAFRWMQAGTGPLLKDRRKKKKTVVVNTKFLEKKKEFEHVFTDDLAPNTKEDIIFVKRKGDKLTLRPNGVVAALKLEEWKMSVSQYYTTMWKKRCTVDQIVLRDNIKGFEKVGLKMEIDPEFYLYLKGKRKFYRKENITMAEIPEKRAVQYNKKLDLLKQSGLWDNLFPYQRHDAAIHAIKNYSFLGYGQGLGKTRTAIAAVIMKETKTNLFICYSRLIKVWYDELIEKMGIDPSDIKIIKTPSDLRDLRKFNIISFERLRQQRRPKIIITCERCGAEVKGKICMAPNPDQGSDRSTCGWNRFKDATCPACGSEEYTGHYCNADIEIKSGVTMKCGYAESTWKTPIYKRMRHLFSCIVVDESQASKNRNSLQGRALRTLKAKHKIILTGTLLENYLSEAFWQLYWLLGASCRFPYPFQGGHSMFNKRFCKFTKTKSGRLKMLPEIQNESVWYAMMDTLMTRRTTKDDLVKDIIKLPDALESRVKIEPTQQEKDLYEQALNDFENWYMEALKLQGELPYWLQGEGKKKLSAAVLVKLNALRRVSSCPFTYNQFDNRVPTSKMKFIRGVVEKKLAAGEKVLISSAFKPVINYLVKRLPDCEGFTGEMPIIKRNEIMDRFQDEEFPRVLVVTTQCCNLGVTLTTASTAIIYDLLWSPKQLEQMWKRIHRVGQTKECDIIFLINSGMIDDDINDLIVKKDAAINKAIDRIDSVVDTELFSPLDFANRLFSGRGNSWITKYID